MNRIPVHLFALTVSAVATLAAQTIVPGGDVSGTWPLSGSPYVVTGDITVPDDSTLTIAPGTRVEFQGHYALYVRGRLLAIGTETDTIVFTVGDTTGFSDPGTTLGGWYGIRMFEPDSTNDSTVIAYCKLSYGKAVGPNWPFNHGGAISIVGCDKVRVSNCLIVNNLAGGPEYPTGGGIGFSSADIVIVGNTIAYNKALHGGGADGQTSGAKLASNLFTNNEAQAGGGLALAWSNVVLSQNIFTNNRASTAGGAVAIHETACRLEKNGFYDNAAPDGGGALIILNKSDVTMEADTLRNNAADSAWGGAVNVVESNAGLKNVTLAHNSASLSGGLHAYRANLVIDSCALEANTALSSNGGGLGLESSTCTLRHSRFVGNSALLGGGALLSSMSTLDLLDNLFAENVAPQGGGALDIWNESDATLNGDTIRNNHSQNGPGGGILIHGATLDMNGTVLSSNTSQNDGGLHAFYANVQANRCLFEGNQATNACGAIGYYCDTLGPRPHYAVRISNTRFLGNSAVASGGAVRFTQTMAETSLAEVVFDGCEFTFNTSNTAASLSFNGSFAGISVSNSTFEKNSAALRTAGLSFAGGARGTVSNCLFEGNQAGGGGGGSVGAGLSIGNRGDIDIINCTFVNNAAASGSALSVRNGSRATITNSICWGNTGAHVAVAAGGAEGAHLAVNYCDLQYGRDSIVVSDPLSTLAWGPGIIEADPLFIDSAEGDFHLSGGSPCIGAGIDSIELGGVWHLAPASDIEGLPRPRPAGTRPDMGAYEEQLASPTGVREGAQPGIPDAFALEQNYPNPFNPTTGVTFRLSAVSDVRLVVYDVLGREVAMLVNGRKAPGRYEVQFDAAGLASGVYLCRLTAGEFVQTRKMIVVK